MTKPAWFDPKITLGNVLTVVAMLGTLMAAYVNLKLDSASAAQAIQEVRVQVEPVDNLITRMAVVERNQVTGRESREEAQRRTDTILEELRKQNVAILQAIARLEARSQ